MLKQHHAYTLTVVWGYDCFISRIQPFHLKAPARKRCVVLCLDWCLACSVLMLCTGPPPVVAPQMDISPEDEAAIGRLEQLGFHRALCIEAFFICDKNEEMAANYLLNHGDDL